MVKFEVAILTSNRWKIHTITITLGGQVFAIGWCHCECCTYILQVTNFEILIARKRWKQAKNAKVWLSRGWYLPSNRAIANVVLQELDLNFQGQTLKVAIFYK